MTSRIPPSRRDPEFAAQRVAKTVVQRVGGSGRVPQAAPTLSSDVAAMLRGRADGGATAAGTSADLAAVLWHGPAAVMANVLPSGLLVLRSATTSAVRVRLGTAPTGSSFTLVTKLNGSTMTTTTVAAGSTSASTSVTAGLVAGDVLTFDITAVGSTTPGSDVLVAVEAA